MTRVYVHEQKTHGVHGCTTRIIDQTALDAAIAEIPGGATGEETPDFTEGVVPATNSTGFLDANFLLRVSATLNDGDLITVGSQASGTLAGEDPATFITSMLASIPGRFKSVQILSGAGAGTYTRPAGITTGIVELWGAGGGGGGSATAAVSGAAGGGGGSGGYLRVTMGLSSTHAYVIGAGGSGGVAGANDGAAGGLTSFAAGTYVANGGTGGKGCAATSTVGGAAGGAGGAVSTGGDINGAGCPGDAGIVLTQAIAFSGAGGSTPGIGGGGVGKNVQGAGVSGANFGAGGSGGCTLSAGAAAAGGGGIVGKIIVLEFS